MTTYKTLIWIILIGAGLVLIQSLNGKREPTIRLNPKDLQNHTWVSTSTGNETQQGHHTRKLIFSSPNTFEIRENFKFSGSTFRNPGKYQIRDSVILLLSMDGSTHMGTLHVHENGKLHIDWLHPGSIHGTGSEVYHYSHGAKEKDPRTITSRLVNTFGF